MKKYLLSLVSVAGIIAVGFASDYTTKLNLKKPAHGESQNTWDADLNANADKIDAAMPILPLQLDYQVTGTLPAGNLPGTVSQTNKQNVYTDVNNFQEISATKATINGPVSITGLSPNQCVQTMSSGLLTTSGASCGGAGGSSALAVNQNGVQITSPTKVLNGLSPPFLITPMSLGATAQWTLDPSSVTLHGENVILKGIALQDASFYVATGTIAGPLTANKVTASTLAVSGSATIDALRVTGSSGLTVDNLASGQCVQTGAGGILTATGSSCSAVGVSLLPSTNTWTGGNIFSNMTFSTATVQSSNNTSNSKTWWKPHVALSHDGMLYQHLQLDPAQTVSGYQIDASTDTLNSSAPGAAMYLSPSSGAWFGLETYGTLISTGIVATSAVGVEIKGKTTVGNITINGTCTGPGCGSGGTGGGVVVPSTFTWPSITVSTITASSATINNIVGTTSTIQSPNNATSFKSWWQPNAFMTEEGVLYQHLQILPIQTSSVYVLDASSSTVSDYGAISSSLRLYPSQTNPQTSFGIGREGAFISTGVSVEAYSGVSLIGPVSVSTITASSATINNLTVTGALSLQGSGNPTFTTTDDPDTYQVVGSSVAPVNAHLAVWSSSHTLIDGGVPGSGVGSTFQDNLSFTDSTEPNQILSFHHPVPISGTHRETTIFSQVHDEAAGRGAGLHLWASTSSYASDQYGIPYASGTGIDILPPNGSGSSTSGIIVFDLGRAGAPWGGVQWSFDDSRLGFPDGTFQTTAASGTGGSGSGVVSASPQFQVPFYGVVGSSNVLVSSPNFTNDGSTITIAGISTMTQTNVSTVTATGVYFDNTSSTMTISSFTATALSAGAITGTGLTASLPVQTNANKLLTTGAINLSGTQATGTMAAARMPALTGAVTTSAGAVATSLAASQTSTNTWSGPQTFISSVTVSSNTLHRGNIAFSSTSLFGVVGSTLADNAAAGNVGEYVSAGPFTGLFPATGVASDAGSISLTAGDWDVAIVTSVQNAYTTIFSGRIGISTTPGNSLTGQVMGTNWFYCGAGGSFNNMASIPRYRMSLSATTTVYFKLFSDAWTTGAPTYTAGITARRVH